MIAESYVAGAAMTELAKEFEVGEAAIWWTLGGARNKDVPRAA